MTHSQYGLRPATHEVHDRQRLQDDAVLGVIKEVTKHDWACSVGDH